MVLLLFTFKFSIFNRSRVSILAAEAISLSNTASVEIADGKLTVSVTARVEEEDIEGEGDADESPRTTIVEGSGDIDVTTVALITVSSLFGISEEVDEEGVGDGVASDHNQANEEVEEEEKGV